MSGKYGGWGRTSQLSASKVSLTTLATCGRALSCWKITLSCLLAYWGRLNFNVRLNLAMNIRFGRWSWCMVGLNPRFSALWIVVVDPLFVPRHYSMQKTLPILPLEQLFAREKKAFDVSWLEFMRNPKSLCLHHTHRLGTIWSRLMSHFQGISVWHESWSNNASNRASTNFTGFPSRSLSLVSKSPLLKRRNQYSHVFINGSFPHMLHIAIDVLQLHFSLS